MLRLPVATMLLATLGSCFNQASCVSQEQNVTGPTIPAASPSPAPSASPGANGTCPVVKATTLSSTGGQQADGTPIPGGVREVKVGSTLNLDITPRDQPSGGQAVPTSCHDPAPSISIAQTGAICSIGPSWSTTGGAFTPTLNILGVGTCLVTASANGHSETKDFTGKP